MKPSKASPEPTPLISELQERARLIRLETLRLAKIAGSGHYTSVFSCAEILAALYYYELRLNPTNKNSQDHDHFILSKGHAAIGLYPILANLGFFDAQLLENYGKYNSNFGDHPDMKKVPGIDFSSGSLGHGLSIGVGIAAGSKLNSKKYNTWVLLGDAELAEGQIWEAAMSATHYKLGKLRAIIDVNQMGIDGFTKDVMNVEPIDEKFRSFGWSTYRINGHDLVELKETLDSIRHCDDERPKCIIADTVKGKGVARMELNPDWHVGNLTGLSYAEVEQELSQQ